MVGRRTGTVRGGLLLALGVLVGYAVVLGIGFWWPEQPKVAIVASVAVSVVAWGVSAVWFQCRTGWAPAIGVVLFAVALLFPMVGAASLGTDIALEERADEVRGVVSDIEVEQTRDDDDDKAWRTTYTFVDEAGNELGTVDYRGDQEAYGLQVGERTDLMVDPDGGLPLKLADRVDSADDIGMTVLGAVLYALVLSLGLVWPAIRPRSGAEHSTWEEDFWII